MLVLTFSTDGVGNCVEVADRPYVFARTGLGSFVMPARCPHRGGPLHLGGLTDDGRLVCPWHGRATSVRRMIRTGVPAVRRGTTVTAVFPDEDGTEHRTTHRPLSADLVAA